LREYYGRLTEEGTQVIVIFPSNQLLLERFLDEFGPYPFQIFGDPERALFRSMGHKSMAKWKLLAKAGKAFIKGGKKAFLPEDLKQQEIVRESLNTQDIYIQGGSWLFDEKGDVQWSHVDESPEDHATIDELIHRVKESR
jgi:hypothetical protein